jgi:thiamine-phosphate pyrophosphorylase
LERVAEQAILGGASVLQLRDKNASDEELLALALKLLPVTRRHGVPLIVNDRPGVAKAAGADGVHLGQDDGPLSEARRLLGARAVIGRSTHSPEQAVQAEREGFDYIGVGPVYATPTKAGRPPVGLEFVRFAAANVRLPFVAIGGIDASNIAEVLAAGAKTVAAVRAVTGAADPQAEAAKLLRMMRERVLA